MEYDCPKMRILPEMKFLPSVSMTWQDSMAKIEIYEDEIAEKEKTINMLVDFLKTDLSKELPVNITKYLSDGAEDLRRAIIVIKIYILDEQSNFEKFVVNLLKEIE